MFDPNAPNSRYVQKSFAIVAIGLLLVGSVSQAQFGGGGGFVQSQPAPNKPGAAAAHDPKKAGPAAPVGDAAEEAPPAFQNGLPSFDVFLKTGLERHPDVVVARSKVEAARAELLQTEATALKSLMRMHQATLAKRKLLDMLKAQNNAGQADNMQVLNAAAEVNLLEWELALTLGFQGPGRTHQPQTKEPTENAQPQAASNPATPSFVDIAYPKGPKADLIKNAFDKEITFNFIDATLEEVRTNLTELTKINFVIDKTAFSDQGYATDSADITLDEKEIKLGTAIQRFEDYNKLFSFVVRDYGILITPKFAGPHDAVSARDFWRMSEDEIEAKFRARQSQYGAMGGGMGGMGGGGMGGGGMGGGGMGGGGGFF
jgi:hypothetical protein